MKFLKKLDIENIKIISDQEDIKKGYEKISVNSTELNMMSQQKAAFEKNKADKEVNICFLPLGLILDQLNKINID